MVARSMTKRDYEHTPVLLTEVMQYLLLNSSGIYVDATFGRGSHADAILKQLTANGRLIAIDQDLSAIAFAKQCYANEIRFKIIHQSFSHLASILQAEQVFGQVQGILFDLGVSSPQLDDAKRGFSFMRDGPLDMRMDVSSGVDAATWLATVDEKTLADSLWLYGEERYSRRIARAICQIRREEAITSTLQLATIIKQAIPGFSKDKHPATRSFQAIRIVINQELQALEQALSASLDALAIGGRLLVISFHSLEDRIVKQFIKHHEQGTPIPRGLPVKAMQFTPRLRQVQKPIKPSVNEIARNPRARSAVLRIMEKLS
jgi:16S rRNA (cytosine1402-N4)-methyltransferase